MNTPIVCLTNANAAQSFNRRLAQQAIPAQVVAKGSENNPLFVVQSARSHESSILDAAKEHGSQTSLIECPSCHSARIDYPSLPYESATMFFFASLMSKPGKNGDTLYCRSCHHQWSKPFAEPALSA